ncbi:MAG: GGDEF domain-containing protein [Planctomycetes bacterium]|nr:GGDEF domain-containing protein [Planctomycetota bacterium]
MSEFDLANVKPRDGDRHGFQDAAAPVRSLQEMLRNLPQNWSKTTPRPAQVELRQALMEVANAIASIHLHSTADGDGQRRPAELMAELHAVTRQARRELQQILESPDGAGATATGSRPTESSLAEQLRLHEAEIANRKALLGLTAEDADRLRRYRHVVRAELEEIVAEFYAQQTSIEEIASIIGDRDTLLRLQAAQRRYVEQLFSGQYDHEYVSNRLRIGLVHKRIGVPPKYYLSAVKTLRDVILRHLSRHLSDAAELDATRDAIDKMLFFDMQLVFDTYLRSMLVELQVARDQAEHHARDLERRVAERTRELAQLTRTDNLTGLGNRAGFVDDLRKLLSSARRTGAPLSLAYFDIDDFKQVNDRFGHLRGDDLLRRVGNCLRKLVRDVDVACRHGGDEFVVALPSTDEAGAMHFAKRLSARMAQETGVRISVGIATTDAAQEQSVDDLIDAADREMYAEKRLRKARRAAAKRSPEERAEGAD